MSARPKEESRDLFAGSASKALTRGLEILRLLAESNVPLNSTEIAAKLGLHQSSASRILKTLSAAGYVRKPTYHSFTVDYGVIALGGRALKMFPLITKPREAILKTAQRTGMLVALGTILDGELIYFLRAHTGEELVSASAGGYPLHLSSVALRILLDRPEREAVEILKRSRQRYGWRRPTDAVPAEPLACLRAARSAMRDDCLALMDFQEKGAISTGVLIQAKGEPLCALAINGAIEKRKVEHLVAELQTAKSEVEAAMAVGT
jgi:DNA-binding IclR family transcriptional regulator